MEKRSESNVITPFEDFHSMLWEEGVSAVHFLKDVTLKTQRIKTLGTTLDDNTIMRKIFLCLSSHSSTFRTSWKMLSKSDSTLTKLKTQLLSVEQDLKAEGVITDRARDAFFSGRKGYGSKKGNLNGKNKYRNYNNSHSSHGQNNFSQRNPQHKNKCIFDCWFCGKSGHAKKECYQRKKMLEEKG
jgi:hypothetical protein